MCMKQDRLLTSSDQDTAQCINDFFSSMFTTEPEADLPSLPDKSKGHCFSDITITCSDILNKLNQLKPINLVAQIIVTHVY